MCGFGVKVVGPFFFFFLVWGFFKDVEKDRIFLVYMITIP